MPMITAMQFTIPMENAEGCVDWFAWFKERGVPAAIIKHEESGRTKYAVYRQGEVRHISLIDRIDGTAHKDYRDVLCGPEEIPDGYKVIMKCNGFKAEKEF